MNDKEKQIEILLLTEAIYESGHGLDWGDCKDIALQLDFLDYRKTPKGSVVLTEERHTALKLIENYHIKSCGKNSVVLTTEELEEIRKQAVKEVLEKVKTRLEKYRLENEYFTPNEPNGNLWQMNSSVFYIEVTQDGALIDEIAKGKGVEV